MKKLVIIPLLFFLLSCAAKEPETAASGSAYEIRGFSIRLENGVLSVRNTYFEKVSRLQIKAEYIKDGSIAGTFVSVGLALEPGDVREYRLVIPAGTEKVRVIYREYPYGEGDEAFFLPNTGRVGTTGSVYFLLNE